MGMRTASALIFLSTDYEYNVSLITSTLASSVEALLASGAFIITLVGVSAFTNLHKCIEAIGMLTLTRRARQVLHPANFPGTPTMVTP